MDGLVADFLDYASFLVNGLGYQVLEGWFMEQSTQPVIVGHSQAGFMAVEPVDDCFQCETGMEAGRTGVAEDVAFCPGR